MTRHPRTGQIGDGLWFAIQFWPLLVVWWAWDTAATLGNNVLPSILGSIDRGITGDLLSRLRDNATQDVRSASVIVALLGPAAVMGLAVMLHRIGVGRRSMALTGVFCMLGVALLSGWPDYVKLWTSLETPGPSPSSLLDGLDNAHTAAVIVGVFIAFLGYCIATRARPVGGTADAPLLQRGLSDNFGHADWLSMKDASKRFPGPDPVFGGLVVGEAYRVDQDRSARGLSFDPGDRRSWGRGGKAPLLIDPCRIGPTHALVVAGSGGFKTTSVGIPTLLAWTGSAVVLDPSREIGPMVADYRRQTLGHHVVFLDPATAQQAGINVLDWIDIGSPLADSHVDSVVNWITTEHREGSSGSGDFFKGSGRDLITCILADLLWNPDLSPAQKTLRAFYRRLTIPEQQMRERLVMIYEQSASPRASAIAGTLMDQHAETFSGVYSNANRDVRWLATPAYADLVSGGAEGSVPVMHTGDVIGGTTTVFLQIPLPVLMTMPSLGRVLVGALLNAAYQADGKVRGRILFLLDEVTRLGYMHLIEQARDAGRKYAITLLLLYQSLGQLVAQWGREGKQAWFDSTSWQLFAAVQDWETARQLSDMCGEYAVVATSTGDTAGSQSHGNSGATTSAGRSENRSEVRRALIKPDELRTDTRADEAFVLAGGSRPLRCGRAIYFRRPEWQHLVAENRFHTQDNAAQ